MTRLDEVRRKALSELEEHGVLRTGHFNFGNGYHGRVYLNPHQLFRHPSTIWRFAQDLLDLLPGSMVDRIELVAGPVTGGALLGHTMAGLLDSRRAMSRAPMLFAPFAADTTGAAGCSHTLSHFYREQVRGKQVLIVDDVRNTGQTQAWCTALVREAGGAVIATAEIYDRLESNIDVGIPNFALAEYKAPENFPETACPMCRAGEPVTTF